MSDTSTTPTPDYGDLARERGFECVDVMERLERERDSLRGERDHLNRELSDICRVADAHTADEACEVIRAMREAIREAHEAIKASPYPDQQALAKLQPFITP